MSQKHTLERIRKTRTDNEEFERTKKENYKSPSGFAIMSRFMKDKNKDIIINFAKENNISENKTVILLDKYHKLNYYTPIVTPFLEKEAKQFDENKL